MFHSSHLQFHKKWSLNHTKSTFSIFFVIEIATFISNFQSRIDIGTFLTIPKIIFHLSIIFVPVGVLDSSFDKLVILKPALKLRSVCQFQIPPPRSIIPGPLSIVSAPIERKEPLPFLHSSSPHYSILKENSSNSHFRSSCRWPSFPHTRFLRSPN